MSPGAPGAPPARPEDVVEAWRRAEAAGDTAGLDRLLTLDFVGVGPRGWRRSRQQWIDRHASGSVTISRLELREVEIRTRGDIALVVAEHRQTGRNGGNDASGRFRLTLTAVRDGEGWRIAGLHVAPLLD